MTYKLFVIAHLLGAAVWIGGHLALVIAILPTAMRERNPQRILEFECGFGKLGLSALGLQIVTGLWLATHWVGDWRTIFSAPTTTGNLVITKLVLLALTGILAGHAYHRVLSRMTPDRMMPFAAHAWTTTVLSVLMLIVGASVRLGGLP